MNAFRGWRHKTIAGVFCLGLLLTGCYDASVSDTVTDHKAAVALAQRFLTDLDTGKSDDLVSISAVPFWGDGHLLTEQAAFEKEARQESSRAGHRMAAFRASHVVPFAEMEAFDAEMFYKLSDKMPTDGLYAVFLAVEFKREHPEARAHTESLLVLVRKDPQGAWRVVGIDD